MEVAAILAREVLVMFLLIAAGVLCKKTGILEEQSARAISNVLLLVVIPAMLVRSFQIERVAALLPGMLLTLVLAVLYHLLCIWGAGRAFPDCGDDGACRIARMAAVFSNCGFMAFPLLGATVGEVGLLYGGVFIGVFNVVTWVWGAPLLTGVRSLSPRQLATNPAILAFVAGVGMFLLGIRLPGIVYSALDALAGINTPLSMLVIGVFLASVPVRDTLRDRRVYRVVLLRNVVFPAATLLCLWGLRVSAWLPGGRAFAFAFLISASCSVAASTILMPARYGYDGRHGAAFVCASTVCVIVTLPLLLLLAGYLL